MSRDEAVRAEALAHRARLTGVVFVAVTGSCGKTTTKDLIASVLGSRYRGAKSTGSYNCGIDIAEDLLLVRPDEHFYVQELGAWGPGTIEPGIDLVRPHVAVVTNLRHDHYSAFRGPRGAQAEKGKLVTCLPATGTAVLNWDDPHVRELAGRTSARVLTFGRHHQADLRARNITAAWPAPLSFEVSFTGSGAPARAAGHGGQHCHVRTRLYGSHLLGSALATLATGLVFGLTLQQAATALAAAPPPLRRMTPVTGDDGVTFVRDDFKAPADSVPEVLDFLREATAARTVAVFGRISDYPGRSRTTYTWAARQALTVVDTVLFVGERAVELWGEQHSGAQTDQARLRQHLGFEAPPTQARGPAHVGGNGHRRQEPPAGRAEMYVFGSVAQAGGFLSDHLRTGDLVLLKGSGPADHLERILLSRYRPVSCWLQHCGRTHSCDDCELLTAAEHPANDHLTAGRVTGRTAPASG